VAALPQREFTGVVSFIDPNVQQPTAASGKGRSAEWKRSSGRGCTSTSAGARGASKAVVVPRRDSPLQGANFVWVVADGKAARRQVGLGVRTPGFVEITSGVDAGEKVVVGGQERLFEGAP